MSPKTIARLKLAGCLLLAIVATDALAFLAGRLDMTAEYERKAAKARVAEVKAEAVKTVKAADIGTAVVVKAVQTDAQREIRYVYLKEKVPEYVTPKADADAVVPVGAVWLHNEAARPTGSDPLQPLAGLSPDAASTITLSAYVGTVVANYGTCNGYIDQLNQILDYDEAQAALYDKGEK